ncbi:MAG: type II toxin-antitoxin system RelE/ParE family toxin [Acidobacteriota bacterium]
MAQPRWSREATESLRDIYEYIAQDRPHTAARTVESILNKVVSLSGSPHLGQRYPYLDRDDIHLLAYGHFRIAYQVDGDGDIVVLGVFHGLIFLPRR